MLVTATLWRELGLASRFIDRLGGHAASGTEWRSEKPERALELLVRAQADLMCSGQAQPTVLATAELLSHRLSSATGRGGGDLPQWRDDARNGVAMVISPRVRVEFRQLKQWYMNVSATSCMPAKNSIEKELFLRLRDLFSLEVDMVFYDLTSTYFEGPALRGSAPTATVATAASA